MRVGFLLNHYAVHQVPHVVPYAFELSRTYPDLDVVIAYSSQAELATANTISTLYPGHRCRFQRLRAAWYYELVDPIVSQWAFKRKDMVLRHNLAFFRTLDALAAPELHSIKLRTKHGLGELKLIYTFHGAGDREVAFDDRVRAFDFILLPGQKYVDRFTELDYLHSGAYAVGGYPKFEVARSLRSEPKRIFANDKPVVLYNPHFDRKVSSWRTMGLQVLDYFAENRDYNLIFAPHVVLFKRKRRHHGFLPEKYRHITNILVDTDSTALSDMTYVLAADMYLGDASSQVYEFLLNPRPCIFLNAHHTSWLDNSHYAHWAFGQVVDEVPTGLPRALENAFRSHPHFLPKQQEAFAYTFRTGPDGTAAKRGAEAIARFLQTDSAHRAADIERVAPVTS